MTVEVDDPSCARPVRGVLASLPASFALTTRGPADVAVVDGSRPGWADRARRRCASGIRAIVIHEPGVEPGGDVRRLADDACRAGVPVRLAEGTAGNPLLADVVPRIAARRFLAATVHSVDPTRSPRDLLMIQMRVLQALRLEVRSASLRAITHHSSVAQVIASDGELSFIVDAVGATGAGAREGRHELRFHGSTFDAEVILHDGATARPAMTRFVGPEYSTELPSVHENGVRAAWRGLAACIDETGDPQELVRFADAADLVLHAT